MTGHEFTPSPERAPQTQPAFSGGPPQPPPRPPKLTARDLLDPGDPGKRIFVGSYIEVAELAEQLGCKPFKMVAELLQMRIFRHADEMIDFPTAAVLAGKRGVIVERLWP